MLSSNSSSLSSIKEGRSYNQFNENNDSKNDKKEKKIKFTNFVKNARNWKNKIKFININNKENNDEKNGQNNSNYSLINDEIYKINKNLFKHDTGFIEHEKYNNELNNHHNSKIIQKAGERTPSVKNNSKLFKSKFGKSKLENIKKMRKPYNFIISNSDSGKNYYNVLKEINKLIKFNANAQEIFSKKTIKLKLKLNNNQKNLNLSFN